ncbi:hypothetical protein ACFPM3_17935 [Streptomyces coeruleoprunus]|uniref:vWA-MoxR associated protein middle region 2 domain-containing protein n=1 Tax=Streptomyces coeruleoprunus TaxID=285563 RepID=A0ABV9XF52_9ACTN
MTEPRHALVIGAQCPDLGHLEELDGAARALHDALTSPWSGACEKDPLHGTTLLCGEPLTRAEVEDAVLTAALGAGRAGAVLVVALLGHGMASGTDLYFMTGGSRAEEPATAVDVGSLLTRALNTQGVAGIIAVVDTCHAANALPDLRSVANGVRQGDTRLSLLMGSSADAPAYGLRFSRTLVKVLQEGLAGGGETLLPAEVVEAVRRDGGTAGQAIFHTEYDGVQFATGRLWLAHNPRHSAGRAGSALLGPLGTEELARALATSGEAPNTVASPVTGTDAALVTNVQELEALPERLASLPPPQRRWALDVVDALRTAVRTVGLLGSWPGAGLTSALLRRTLAEVCPNPATPLPESSGTDLLRDAVEYLLLRAPLAGRRRTAPLAEFLAVLAGGTGVDAQDPLLRGWAAAVGAEVDLNDAFERLADRSRDMRLRLVVSLHAAVGDDWPESLAAWLLDDGVVRRHEEFDCVPDRTGVERRIGEVLRWASRLAGALDAELRRVEIAAPAPLLVHWRPEETDFGMRLGAEHEVVVRWSDRIHPPDHLWWINDRARRTLRAMDACPDGSRLDWLDEGDTGRPRELGNRLLGGPRSRAVALGHRPAHLKDLMETLLAASPIVLWPEDDTHRVPPEARGYVDAHWHLLPGEFCRAYRDRWGWCETPPPPGREHLAPLRTVWDGPEWLDFCRWFEQFTTDGESPA